MEYMTDAMQNYYDAVDAYLTNCKANSLSNTTLQSYTSVLTLYGDFLSQNGYEESGPTPKSVTEWKIAMSARGKKASSIRQMLIQLRMFFAWAGDADLGNYYYTENPVSTKQQPKTNPLHTRPYENLLTQDEVALLLQDTEKSARGGRKLWARNYAVVAMLLTTAMRNLELLDLTPNDLDYERGIIKIWHGKGDKYRAVQFPKVAQEAVKKYLKSGYRPAFATDSDPLFGTNADEDGHPRNGVWRRGSTQWLSKIVMNHVRKITGRENVRTHALRHASAATMLCAGLPTEEIQVILGHSDIETTQRYTGRLAEAEVNRHAIKIFDEMEYIARRGELREAG